MRFAVLGSLEVRSDAGTVVPLTGPVRRQLLAALLCRAGRSTSAETLIADLWGPAPPRSAAKTLQSHVVRLRNQLGRDVVRTDATGYRLDVDTADVDALEFEHLARTAEQSEDVVGQLERALELWRDDAYVEFGDAAFAVAERLRLAELRAAVRERRTDLALDRGRAPDLIGELEAGVAAEPYRERGWERLILALYRCGRQADALATYRRARDLLAADLGVDPGPDLRDLEARILRHDDALSTTLPPRRELPTGQCPYRGLAGYRDEDSGLFVGRERLTAELAGLLADGPGAVVTGPSGSGKSSLLHAGLLPALRAGALPGSASWRAVVRTPTEAWPDDADLIVIDQAEELFTVLDRDTRQRKIAGLRATRIVVAIRGDFYDRLPELGPLADLSRTTMLVRPMRDDETRRAVVEPATRLGYLVEPAMIETVLDEISGRPGALPLLSAALVRAWQNRDGETITLAGYQKGGGIAGALEATAEECFQALDPDARQAARFLLVRLATLQSGSWVRRPIPLEQVRPEETAARTALTEGRLVTVDHGRVEIVHDALLTGWPRLRDWLDERARAAELLEHLSAAATSWQAAGRPDADLYRGTRLHAAADWAAEHPDDLDPLDREFLDAATRADQRELAEARERADREAAGRRRLRYLVAGLATVLVAAVAAGIVAVRARTDSQRQAKRAQAAALAADARRLAAQALSAPDLRTGLLSAVAAYKLQDSTDTRSALLSVLEKSGSARYRISTANRLQWLAASADGSALETYDNLGNVLRFDARTRKQVGSFQMPSASGILALSPDGTTAVATQTHDSSGGGPGPMLLIDATTGKVRDTFAASTPEGANLFHTAAFTRDGRHLVTLNYGRDTQSSQLRLLDTADLTAPGRTIHADGPIGAIATGLSTVAVVTTKGEIEIVDADTGQVEHRGHIPGLRVDFANGGPVVAVSPDGSRIAISSLDGTHVDIAQSSHLSAPPVVAQLPDASVSVGFSPGGTLLAIGGLAGSVSVLTAATGQPAQHLTGGSGPVLGLAWSGTNDSNAQLFTAGLDSQIVAWDLNTGPRMLALRGPTEPTASLATDRSIAFGVQPLPQSLGGTAAAAQVKFDLTDLRTGVQSRWPAGLHNDDSLESLSSDASFHRALLSITDAAGNGRYELWDLKAHTKLATLTLPSPNEPPGLGAISRDGTTAAIATSRTQLRLYRLPGFTAFRTITVHFRGPVGGRVAVQAQAFAPDGRIVVAGADPGPSPANPGPPPDELLGLVDPATGALQSQLALGGLGDVGAMSWSPDGSRLVVGTLSGRLWLLDAHTLKVIVGGVPAVAGFVLSAEFSPDGRTIVVGGTDATVSFFDARTLQRIGTPLAMPGQDWTVATYTQRGDQVAGYAAVAQGGQRQFTFPGDPHTWAGVACSIAGSDFTRAEWQRYVGDRPYTPTCATH